MRIVFHNPHADQWFGIPVNYFFTRTKSVEKYKFIFDQVYTKQGKIFICLDYSNCLVNGSIISFIRRFFPPIIEFYIWTIINKLNPFKFKILKINDLKKNDVLFSFLISHFTNLSGAFNRSRKSLVDSFKTTKALKVIHLTHYGYNASIGSKNTQEANIDLFISENNLSKNSYFFKNYFNWYKKDVYNLPFVPKKRFKKLNEFINRKNKALATGTLTSPIKDMDFLFFFRDGQLQPMRLEIYKNQHILNDHIDSFIYKFDRKKAGMQKCYSFNIVEKYNEYKMFICPEECIDLPGIGFVEGMACGSAFIGKKDPMYENIGLIDRVHYIGYNGTLDDLTKKIEYYQNHNDELEKIANAGNEFVKLNFNETRVFDNFIKFLEKEVSSRCI